MQRPQQFFLSSSSKEEASFLGQVIPAFPKSRTSDSLMPFDLYGHILGCLVGINFYNDPRIAQDAIELLHSLKEKRSAAIGMVSAFVSANASTHAIDVTRPAQNT